MNTLTIESEISKTHKTIGLLSAVVLIVTALFVLLGEDVYNAQGVLFYVSLTAFAVGVLVGTVFLLWKPKTLVTVNIEGLYAQIPGLGKNRIVWDEVAHVIIGLSFLDVVMKTEKRTKFELGKLRYNDLKEVKSKVMELCETKNISYQNA